MSRLTLAQQLAQLEDPAPIDIDPENAYNGTDNTKEGSDMDVDPTADVNREHYVEVGLSSIRRMHDSLLDPKYAARKINRPLGEAAESSEEESLDFDSDDPPRKEDEIESSYMENSEANGSDNASGDEESSDNPVEEFEKPSKRDHPVEEDVGTHLQQIRDAERRKGLAVKSQLATWDALLDARIQLQKCATLCNGLPLPNQLVDSLSDETIFQALQSFVEESLLLSNELFGLEKALASSLDNFKPPTHNCLAVPSASNIETLHSLALQASQDHVAMQASFHLPLVQTLQKWSSKIQAVTPSLLLPSNRNKFSTSVKPKSTLELIQESVEDLDSALSRTRVYRGIAKEEPIIEDEIFDDTDFYQQLLREIIEGRADEPNGHAEEDHKPTRKKEKRQIDTKASKGRKLRYEVHEKIQNFMVPMPNTNEWHEEKVDELFTSLLGRSLPQAMPQKEDITDNVLDNEARLAIRKDGFRVFG